MEEQKIVSKEVKMKPAGHEQKLTYEQLNQACAELSQQVQQQNKYIQTLRQQMQEMNFMLQTKRMDYLLKIVEISMKPDMVWKFDADFIIACIEEIQESMAPQEEDDSEEHSKND